MEVVYYAGYVAEDTSTQDSCREASIVLETGTKITGKLVSS